MRVSYVTIHDMMNMHGEGVHAKWYDDDIMLKTYLLWHTWTIPNMKDEFDAYGICFSENIYICFNEENVNGQSYRLLSEKWMEVHPHKLCM